MRPRFPAPPEVVERRLPRPEYKAMFRAAAAQSKQLVTKVETRQLYQEDNDRGLRAYQVGDLEAMYEVMAARKPLYTERMRVYTDRGVEFRRLRLIERPLTDYTRWELENFLTVNIPAGEWVFLVERTEVAGLADEIALDDFVLFDDELAFANIYSCPEGVPSGAYLIRDRGYLAALAEVVETLAAVAVPFADFPLSPISAPARTSAR